MSSYSKGQSGGKGSRKIHDTKGRNTHSRSPSYGSGSNLFSGFTKPAQRTGGPWFNPQYGPYNGKRSKKRKG